MIDGMWWLVILLAVVIVLWLLAKARGKKPRGKKASDGVNQTTLTHPKYSTNDALHKTMKLVQRLFAHTQVTRKANHLLVSENSKKIAMITIDKKLAMGQRLLGEVTVINYHSVPNSKQLVADLNLIK